MTHRVVAPQKDTMIGKTTRFHHTVEENDAAEGVLGESEGEKRSGMQELPTFIGQHAQNS